jgi:hypothetical protein
VWELPEKEPAAVASVEVIEAPVKRVSASPVRHMRRTMDRPWVFINIRLHGSKVKDRPFIMDDTNYIIRGCPDNVLTYGILPHENVKSKSYSTFNDYITPQDTVESIIAKKYPTEFIEQNWVLPQSKSRYPEIYKKYKDNYWALETPGESMSQLLRRTLYPSDLNIPLLYGEKCGTRDKMTPRLTSKVRDKILGVNNPEKETYANGWGVRLIETNVEELREPLIRNINRINDSIMDGGRKIWLSAVIKIINTNILQQYCKARKTPPGIMFISDLSCNGGLTHEEACADFREGAWGKTNKKRKSKNKRKIVKRQSNRQKAKRHSANRGNKIPV